MIKKLYEIINEALENNQDLNSEEYLNSLREKLQLDDNSFETLKSNFNLIKEIFGETNKFISKLNLIIEPNENYNVETEIINDFEKLFSSLYNELSKTDLDPISLFEVISNALNPDQPIKILDLSEDMLSMIGNKIKNFISNNKNVEINKENETEEEKEVINNSKDERDIEEPLFNSEGKIKKYQIGKEIFIIDEDDLISEKEWGKVDTDGIKRMIVELAEIDERKTRALAEEIFLYVKCTDSAQCLKFPVAELVKDGDVYKIKYNRKGLATAITYLNYPVVKNKYTKEELDDIKNKARDIYEKVFGEIPLSLQSSKEISLDWEKILSKALESDEIIDFAENKIKKYKALETLLKSSIDLDIIEVDGEVLYIDQNMIDNINKVMFNAIEKIINITKGNNIDDVDSEINQLKDEIKNLTDEKNKLLEIMNSIKKEISDKDEIIKEQNKIINSYKVLEKKYTIVRNELLNSNKGFLVEAIDSIESEEEFNTINKILNKLSNSVINDIKINNSVDVKPNIKEKQNSNPDDEIIDNIRKKVLNLIN